MGFVTKRSGEYITEMARLAELDILAENHICGDCDEEFYEGEAVKAARDHGVMRLKDNKGWSLIVGCEGAHMFSMTGMLWN